MSHRVLSIAGSDPSGGAGLQADLKVFERFGVYGYGFATLHTIQNTRGVSDFKCVDAEWLAATYRELVVDMPPLAVKTGALGSAATAQLVGQWIRESKAAWVIDPVNAATRGLRFADAEIRTLYLEAIIPHAAVVTPNALEATWLTEIEVCDVDSAKRAGEALVERGAQAALLKGGHLPADGRSVIDFLVTRAGVVEIEMPRLEFREIHGTGCAYSAAIAAGLAKGNAIESAVSVARHWLQSAMESSIEIGAGSRVLNFRA